MAISENLSTGEATGAHLTGVLGQGVAKQMGEMFNNPFSQVGQKLEKSVRPINKKYGDYLNERVGNSFII